MFRVSYNCPQDISELTSITAGPIGQSDEPFGGTSADKVMVALPNEYHFKQSNLATLESQCNTSVPTKAVPRQSGDRHCRLPSPPSIALFMVLLEYDRSVLSF